MNKLTAGAPLPTPLRLLPWTDTDPAIPVDYHLHTSHTDGTASVQEMAHAAASAGVREILFSEHIRHTSTYYPAFAAEVRALTSGEQLGNAENLRCYLGMETKILDLQGTLDCPPSAIEQCDAIIGSVHSPPDENGQPGSWSRMDATIALEREFELALSIVTHSRAHILGHPLGIVITRFGLKPLDHLYQLACACRDSGKAFELNARYCPDPSIWIDIVQRAGCKVSFGSDAHTTTAVGTSWNLFMQTRLTT